ncbi:MAG: DUF4340 domain-containing protein [Gammaproteobacteria bacterium]|nr:DUF4340 domain-containing protein [Gammaproteobacteria bacterium]
MKKNRLINLSLLLVALLLALLAIYEPGIKKPTELPSLVQLKREAVEHILIRRANQPNIELERDDAGHWQLLQPLKATASDFRIDALLRVTASKSLGSFAAAEKPLSDYQLAHPQVELVLNGTTRIAFGSNTPLDHRRYVLLDETVHLISDTLYYHLIGTFPTFVSRRPLPQGSSISVLQLPQLHLQWRDERWQVEPRPEDYSADRLSRLLDAWQYASANQVKAYDGNAGEAITVQLDAGEQPFEFLLTAREPDLILARPKLGIQYHFPAEAAAQLLQFSAAEPDGDLVDPDRVN